jgi:hypothetical protein
MIVGKNIQVLFFSLRKEEKFCSRTLRTKEKKEEK